MKFLESDALLDLLIKYRLLTKEQRALVEQEKGKARQKLARRMQKDGSAEKPDLVDVLVEMQIPCVARNNQILDEELIMRLVAAAHNLPFKKLDPLKLDVEVITKTLPRNFAIRHFILPFELKDGVLSLATYHPDNKSVLSDVEQANKVKVVPYITTKSDIRRILSESFGFQKSISAAEDQLNLNGHGGDISLEIGNLERYVQISSNKEISSSDQHIKSAVNHILQSALEQRASDIHIEPKRDTSLVRFRIDGILHTIYRLPIAVHPALIARVKFLARLDIAEKRRPQDGRIKIGLGADRDVEIRVSTVPVSFGEKMVMRLLDPTMMFQNISQIGFSERDLKVFKSFMDAPHGIVLVTGPTGSGKSTTLYSALKEIATPDINITTIEDPVEMVHEEFNQIAVQPLIDVTFSTILRNILRQDPDVIMIGEIRDYETAAHAVQAAMTGHLVFSTLHTNDAILAIDRLRDLGLQPFMIASTLLGCMAQRLVKTICPDCKKSYQADTATLIAAGFPVRPGETIKLYRGEGCRECRNTGYKGRCGIFEIFPLSSELQQLVASGGHSHQMRELALKEGMTTLRQDAWRKILSGVTTLEEAMRVTTA
ncbi:MAG: Flp pilus assembly complex ATPase component TadA [Desulfobulbaceae bacterium]|jgi:general secretion pathway protein E|nr:Flp pilus assembly complex ATPase component TadA [Desulfobulbaceae bacterium]